MILNERKRSFCQPFPYFTKWFQMYFNALLAQFFNFPSRYFVRYRSWQVFSFRGLWPPAFRTKNSIRTTLVSMNSLTTSLHDYHVLRYVFPYISLTVIKFVNLITLLTLHHTIFKFKLYRFQSSLLAISHFCFIFLLLIRYFSSESSLAYIFTYMHTL